MLNLTRFTAIALLLLGLSANLSAESVALPDNSAKQTEFSVQLPGRAMSMETVQKRFGEPTTKYPAVGQPPITKWVYEKFTVYFESEYVIHAVVNY